MFKYFQALYKLVDQNLVSFQSPFANQQVPYAVELPGRDVCLSPNPYCYFLFLKKKMTQELSHYYSS